MIDGIVTVYDVDYSTLEIDYVEVDLNVKKKPKVKNHLISKAIGSLKWMKQQDL